MSRVRYILRFCAERRGDATLIGGPPSRAAAGHAMCDAAVTDSNAQTFVRLVDRSSVAAFMALRTAEPVAAACRGDECLIASVS